MRLYLGTWLLLFAISACFALEIAVGAVANDAALIALGALPDSAVLDGEYWRLVSFGFLHWNLNHLMLNSALLFAAGPISEQRIGTLSLMLVFAAGSVSSGVGIYLKHLWWPSQGASVGASGGMFGLLGLALVLLVRFPPRRSVIRNVVALATVGGFAYSVLPGVSMVGHVVGFMVGALIGWFLAPRVGWRPVSD